MLESCEPFPCGGGRIPLPALSADAAITSSAPIAPEFEWPPTARCGTARGSAGTHPLRRRGLRAPIEQHSVQVSDRPLVSLLGCGSLSILIAVSGCGSSPARSSSTAANSKADVDVVLTGPLSGSFATCRLDKDGDAGDTVLGGYV